MTSIHRQPFTSSGEFSVRKPFTFDNKVYKPDDDFPYEELDCSSRKLRNLYEAGYLKHKVSNDNDLEDKLSNKELRKLKKAKRVA